MTREIIEGTAARVGGRDGAAASNKISLAQPLLQLKVERQPMSLLPL